ncbi:MAG: hypothetical protein VW258_00080 [Thalassolituus sp.]
MESVSDYYLFWGIYIAAGVAGFWCWGRMLFWLRHKGVGYHLYSAIGAVLIFTPVAVPESPSSLAPGFIAVAFSLISSGVGSLAEFAPWYGVASAIACFVTIAALVAGIAPSVAEDATEKHARKAKSDPRNTKHVKGNPFA